MDRRVAIDLPASRHASAHFSHQDQQRRIAKRSARRAATAVSSNGKTLPAGTASRIPGGERKRKTETNHSKFLRSQAESDPFIDGANLTRDAYAGRGDAEPEQPARLDSWGNVQQ